MINDPLVVVALVLAFLMGVASGFPWGALWDTWRRRPGPMPWTDATGKPGPPLPTQPGEQISIEDLLQSATRRKIDKQGETEVPAENLKTAVGDRLGPDV